MSQEDLVRREEPFVAAAPLVRPPLDTGFRDVHELFMAKGPRPLPPETLTPQHLPLHTAMHVGATSPMNRRVSPGNLAPGQAPY